MIRTNRFHAAGLMYADEGRLLPLFFYFNF